MAAMASKVSATKTVTAKGVTCQTVEAAASMEAVEASTAQAEAASMKAVKASTAYVEAATTSVSAATVPGRCNSGGKSDRCTDCGDGGNADERFSEHVSVSSLERCPRLGRL